MHVTSETTADGMSERLFTHDDVPGVLWAPAAEDVPGRPLVLIAHGGGQHKQAPGLLARARHLVSTGFAVLALDAPGHGERPRTEADQRLVAGLRERMSRGEPAGREVAAYNADVAARAVPEWRAVLDALARTAPAPGPVGFWGLSLGAAVGVRLLAAEPRISAAVVGLIGVAGVAEAASSVTVPVRLLVQWDDELVPRASSLALFEAFGSVEKSLQAHPGRHAAVPRSEVEESAHFLARRLRTDEGG